MKYLQPILEKLKKKEAILDELTGKAREYICEYKKNGETLNKTIEKYKLKKLKLNKLVENVSNLRRETKEKEAENAEKEKSLLLLEREINLKSADFEANNLKFNKFVEAKSKELLTKAEAFKSESLNVKNFSAAFTQKETEINEKLRELEKKESELQNNLLKFNSEKCDFDIQRRDFDLTKEEFDLYSHDVISKYEEVKSFKSNFSQQSQKLKEFELLINEKHFGNIEAERKLALEQSDVLRKYKELEDKQLVFTEKEKEFEAMKILLQEKLVEYKDKVDEAHRVKERLKEKENILAFKSDIENEIDLKLTGLELNETINKKKIAVQQKMLNDEIAKRLTISKLAKRVVKGGAAAAESGINTNSNPSNSNNISANHNSNNSNKSNFSKLMGIIKGIK